MEQDHFTPKQRLFIGEYIECRNATLAAKRAGYSKKTARSAGSRLLTNVDIMAEIQRGFTEQLERADIKANNVVLELRRMAFTDENYPEKIKALELFGNTLGLFQNKIKP